LLDVVLNAKLLTFIKSFSFVHEMFEIDNWTTKRIEMRKFGHYYVLSTQPMSLHSFPTHPKLSLFLNKP
jgi:hypothetical protein